MQTHWPIANTHFVFIHFQINYFIDTDFVDIEKPAEKSQPFNIHLFGDTAFLQTLSLPIHFRYHEPANRRYYSVNKSPISKSVID